MAKLVNLFRPVPNANKKQQIGQIVKILMFNERTKRRHMRKASQKRQKNTKIRRETVGKRVQNKKDKKGFFSFDHVARHLLGDPLHPRSVIEAPFRPGYDHDCHQLS